MTIMDAETSNVGRVRLQGHNLENLSYVEESYQRGRSMGSHNCTNDRSCKWRAHEDDNHVYGDICRML